MRPLLSEAKRTRFLFVTHTRRIETPFLDPSSRYRCYHPAQDLSRRGHIADVIAFTKLTLDQLSHYDVVLFHRPPMTTKLERCIEELQRNGIPHVADYDDLIFDARHAAVSSVVRNGTLPIEQALESF